MFAWGSNPWVWAITFKIASGPLPSGRRERPILFKGELVRAIMEGRKTQTRRPVKLRDWIFRDRSALWNDYRTADLIASKHNPYGQPGDRLWCKESHQFVVRPGYDTICAYRATCPNDAFDFVDPFDGAIESIQVNRWRPSIHMPRWASRLSLEIVSVRVERLHAITEEDAKAEGVESRDAFAAKWREIHDGKRRRAA